MKLDNKGWGLNTLLTCVAIILIALIVSGYYIFKLYNSLGKEITIDDDVTNQIIEDITPYYLDKLTEMDKATLNYVQDNNITVDINQELLIRLDTLVSYNYITEIKDKKTNNICKGYTLIDYNQNTKSYISCDNYTSKGYGE